MRVTTPVWIEWPTAVCVSSRSAPPTISPTRRCSDESIATHCGARLTVFLLDAAPAEAAGAGTSRSRCGRHAYMPPRPHGTTTSASMTCWSSPPASSRRAPASVGGRLQRQSISTPDILLFKPLDLVFVGTRGRTRGRAHAAYPHAAAGRRQETRTISRSCAPASTIWALRPSPIRERCRAMLRWWARPSAHARHVRCECRPVHRPEMDRLHSGLRPRRPSSFAIPDTMSPTGTCMNGPCADRRRRWRVASPTAPNPI